MAIKVTADFSQVSEQADRLSKSFSDSLSKASKAGAESLFGSYAKTYKKIGSLQADLERQRLALGSKQSELEVKNRLKAARGELSHAKFADKIRLENAEKLAALRLETDKDTQDALKAEIRSNQSLLALSNRSVSSAKKLNEEIADICRSIGNVGKNIAGIEKDSEKFVENLKEASDRAETAAKEIHDFLKDLGDASKFGDKIEGVGEKIGEAFKDGIDVQALSQDLGKGVGKVLSTVGKSMGGNAGVMVGALGGVVAMVGLLLAAFIGFDKKVKEFNKDIIKTHGALSVMRLGAGDLNKGLTIMKHTVMDLTGNLGVSEEEAKALFQSLDNGNLTLSRLTGGTADAALAQRRLSASLRDTYTAANMTGVGLSEYADNLTNYVNDLGMSTETVNDNFRSIAKMASESGFSTRRFYSMVVQATSGQSALNVHLEQTGDLLLRMSKIMGMKKAAEMVGGAAGDMGGMAATERIRTLLIAGGRGQRVFGREATQQAKNFAQDRAGMASAFGKALETAGLTGRGLESAFASGATNPQELVNRLGTLNAESQRALLSGLRASGEPGAEDMARQLESLVNLSRGATGGLSARVGSMQDLSAGGSMAMRAAMVQRIVGNRAAGDLSAPERAAAESVSGMSGHQMDAFISQIKAQQGDFETMTRLSKRTDAASQATVARLAGLYHVTVANGKILDESHHELRDGNDLFQSNASASSEALEKTRDESTQLAYQTMDATVSIADIMENKIAQILQHVYDVLNGPINAALTFVVDHFPGLGDGGAAAKALKVQHDALQQIDEKIAGTASIRSKRVRDIASARVTANSSDASETDRSAARERLARLQADQQRENQALEHMQSIRSSVASGNTYYTREGAGHDDFMNTTQNMTQIPPGWHRGPNGTVVRDTGAPAPTAPGATPGATPAAAPGVTPGTAAPTVAPTPPPPTPAHAEAATAPVVAATEDVQTQAQEQHQQLRRDARQRDRQAQVFNEKLLKGRDLGDGLAMSKLPDAIAEADAKVRLTEALFKGGKTSDEVARILAGRNLTEADTGNADYGGMIRSRQSRVDAGVHDFISQDRGGRTVITPINRADQVMGMKPGGPVANAASRGGGGNVNISINGGDERRVFDVVRRAIQQAGITPNRVPGG